MKLNLQSKDILNFLISLMSFLCCIYFKENFAMLFFLITYVLFLKRYIQQKEITKRFLIISIVLGLAYVYFHFIQCFLTIIGYILKGIHFIMSLLSMQI